MPSLYGPDSATKNSLVADGCIIDGTVENCIIFKGVKIGKAPCQGLHPNAGHGDRRQR